ncbi:MAG: sigma-70 family RNA polymerase sigma factor [Bacteroidales bacterium]|nr:sigma-70 family RNA polymerase sigma factor [Bacteroidales bacterium]
MKQNTSYAQKRALQSEEYATYSRLLYPSCLRILANPAEAEEAMHDTLLHYFAFTGHFDSEAQKRSWLFKVAASKSIDRLRKKNREPLPKEDSFPEQDTIGYNRAEREIEREVERVKRGLASLAPGYRTILSLFLFEGYDFEEIASILSLRPATIRSQYTRGRIKLKEILLSSNHFTL